MLTMAGGSTSGQWQQEPFGKALPEQTIARLPTRESFLSPSIDVMSNRTAGLIADVPIPLKSTALSADDFKEVPIDKELAALPISDKLQHRDWKIIQMGCSELEEIVRSQTHLNEDFYQSMLPVLRQLLRRPQTMVQESVICAFRALLQNCPSRVIESGDELVESCAILCEKGLCGRTRAREAAEDVFITLSKNGRKEEVSRALTAASVAKSVKVSCAAISMLAKFVKMFGVESCNLSEMAAHVPKWFSSRDPAARKGAIAVLAAIAPCVSESTMKTFTSQLSSIHLKELLAVLDQQHERPSKVCGTAATQNSTLKQKIIVEKLSEKPKILSTARKVVPGKSRTSFNTVTKQLHSRSVVLSSVSRGENKQLAIKKQRVAANNNSSEDSGQNSAGLFDLLESLTPHDYSVLENGIWKDKVVVLESIIDKAKSHRLAQKDYSPLLNLLEKQLSDSNVMVVRVTLNLLEAIGHSLQESFSSIAKRLVPLILPKLKDANKSLQSAALKTLSTFTTECISIIEVSEDVSLTLESKVPSEIQNTFMWISLSMNSRNELIARDIREHFGVIFNWCIRGFEMEQLVCRREAGYCFTHLVALDNGKGLSLFKSLSISVAQKVKANVSNELTDYLSGKVPAFSSKSIPERNPFSQRQVLVSSKTKNSLISRQRALSPATTTTTTLSETTHQNPNDKVASNSSFARTVPKTVPQLNEEQEKGKENAKISLDSVITNSILDALKDGEWKVRQDAIVEISNTIKIKCNGIIGPELGVIPKFLLPCLADRNRNVQKSSIELCVEIATAMGKSFEKHINVFFPDLFALLGDVSSSVRSTVDSAINSIIAIPGLPMTPVIAACVQALMKTASVKCKEGVLSLLLTLSSRESWSQNITPNEIQLLTKPLLFCLVGNTREARHSAAELLSRVSQFFSLDYIRAIIANDTDFSETIRSQLYRDIELIAKGDIDIFDKALKRKKSGDYAESALVKKVKASSDALAQSPKSDASASSKKEQRERENSSVHWSFTASDVPMKFLSRMAGYLAERIPRSIVAFASSENLGERFKSVKQLCGWIGSHASSVGEFEDVLFMVATTLLCSSDQLVLNAGISLVEKVLAIMEGTGSTLDDYDISILLPFLLQAPMRCSPEAARAVLSKIRSLYPSSKLFEQVLSYVAQKDWLGIPSTLSSDFRASANVIGVSPSLELELVGCLNEISVELGTRRASVCNNVSYATEILSKFLSFSSESVRNAASIACTWLAIYGGQKAADAMQSVGVGDEMLSKFVSGSFLEWSQLPEELREVARTVRTASNSKLPLAVLLKKFSDYTAYFKEFLNSFTSSNNVGSIIDQKRWDELDALQQIISQNKESANIKIPVDLVPTLSELVFCLVEQQNEKASARNYACSLAQLLVDLLNLFPQTAKAMELPSLKKLLFFIMESISSVKLEQGGGSQVVQADSMATVLPLLHRTALERVGLLPSLIALIYIIKDFVDLDSPSGLAFETDAYVCRTLFQQQQLLSESDVKTSELVPLLEAVHSLFVSVQYRKAVVSRKEVDEGALFERVLRFIMKTAFALVRHLVELLGPSIRTSLSFLKVPPFNSQQQTLGKFVETCLSRMTHQEHAKSLVPEQLRDPASTDSADSLVKARERLNSLRFVSPPTTMPASAVPSNSSLEQIKERLSDLENVPRSK